MLEYQTLIMREDFTAADSILPSIPRDQLARVAQFLEKQGFKEKALAVTTDLEHKFELALGLQQLELAFEIVEGDKENVTEQKWRQIADAATKACNFQLAQECMARARDYGSLLLLASCTGNRPMLDKLTHQAADDGQQNIAFLSSFLLNDLDGCLQLLLGAGRFSEAAFFCRAYLPSKIPAVVDDWKKNLASKANKKIAEALANPAEYPNLFSGYDDMKQIEMHLRTTALDMQKQPASAYLEQEHMWQRNPTAEWQLGRTESDNEEGPQIVQENDAHSSQEDIKQEIEEELAKDDENWDEENEFESDKSD